MPVNMDYTIIEKIGIAGVAFVAIYFGYKMMEIFIAQWKVSTEAINRNTESFEKLTEVVDRAAKREQEFQREATELLYEIRDLTRETNYHTHKIFLHLELNQTKEGFPMFKPGIKPVNN